MMASMEVRLQRGKVNFTRLLGRKWVQALGRYLLCGVCGFCLSAASLLGAFQSLSVGLVLAAQKGAAVAVAMGSAAGYLFFWGQGAIQPLCWVALALAISLAVGSKPLVRQAIALLPSLAALIIAASGVFFQVYFRDPTPVSVYLLRLLAAVGSSCLFLQASERRSPVTAWLIGSVAVLSLSGITLFSTVNLGYVAAGAVAAAADFPGIILAGVGMDAAQITPVPMTAVLCVSYLGRLMPRNVERTRYFGAFFAFLLFSAFCGGEEYLPAFWLLLGSGIGGFFPYVQAAPRKFGRTGAVQVQLETAAGVLSRSGAVLAQMKAPLPDEQALLDAAAKAACSTCPCRKGCEQKEQTLPVELLHREGSCYCRKSGRMQAEIHRAQQKYRLLLANCHHRENCLAAVGQQYGFLSEYLQSLADGFLLSPTLPPRFHPEVALCSTGKKEVCGDTGTWFAGTENRYYLLLSDGMGTGLGAAQESRRAVQYLKELLRAGFPGEYAMQSMNSFAALQGAAGMATADLLQLRLDTGRAVLYKWGAAPSYLVHAGQIKRIDCPTTQLGLTVEGKPGGEIPLTLHTGDYFVMVSDGIGSETVKKLPESIWREPAGEIAGAILAARPKDLQDDASVLVLCLRSARRR